MSKRLLFVLIFALLTAVQMQTQDETPVSFDGFTARSNQGQISLIFPDDPNTQWLQVWIGTGAPEWNPAHHQWYEKSAATCNGTSCELFPVTYPSSGSYVAFIQPYGNGRYHNDDPLYWAGPAVIDLNFPAPAAVAGLSVSASGNQYRFSWQGSPGATWYQLWIGQTNPLDTRYMNWFSAYGTDCGDASACDITIGITLKFGETYEWWVQAWGPGGYSVGGTSGWTQGPSITIGSTDSFGLGGHVDSFNYPELMQDAGMTWVKRQVYYTFDADLSLPTAFIEDARAKGFNLMLSVVGNTSQLNSNRSEFIQKYSIWIGQIAALMDDGGAIEVWNEPNIDREWPTGQISGGNYTDLLKSAYGAIKSANPNIMVISAAPAPTGAVIPGAVVPDDVFIAQMRDAGAANYFDCVGMHYNEGIVPPTASSGDPRGNSTHHSRYYPAMVQVYGDTFPSKPLCFTELGYLTSEGYGGLPAGFEWAAGTSLQEHALWLGEAARLSRENPRVRMMIVWNVDFTRYDADPMAGFAIIRPGGGCPACGPLATAMTP